MKKLLIASNMLLLGIIIFQGCRVTDNHASSGDDSPAYTTKRYLHNRAIDVDYKQSPTLARPVVMEGMIDYKTAKKMSLDYKNDPNKGTIRGGSVPDATCIWFNLETLQQYFDNIRASVSGKSCELLLGIRMYYIKYPSDVFAYASTRTLLPEVNDHHSIMLVPTYYDRERQIDIDFDINNVGDASCKPRPYYMTSDTSTSTQSILGFVGRPYYMARRPVGQGVPLALNHGGISPPPFNEDGTFPVPDGPGINTPEVKFPDNHIQSKKKQ